MSFCLLSPTVFLLPYQWSADLLHFGNAHGSSIISALATTELCSTLEAATLGIATDVASVKALKFAVKMSNKFAAKKLKKCGADLTDPLATDNNGLVKAEIAAINMQTRKEGCVRVC